MYVYDPKAFLPQTETYQTYKKAFYHAKTKPLSGKDFLNFIPATFDGARCDRTQADIDAGRYIVRGIRPKVDLAAGKDAVIAELKTPKTDMTKKILAAQTRASEQKETNALSKSEQRNAHLHRHSRHSLPAYAPTGSNGKAHYASSGLKDKANAHANANGSPQSGTGPNRVHVQPRAHGRSSLPSQLSSRNTAHTASSSTTNNKEKNKTRMDNSKPQKTVAGGSHKEVNKPPFADPLSPTLIRLSHTPAPY